MNASLPPEYVRHRPWPVPRSPWFVRQNWDETLFAHWPLDPERVRPHVPPQLALDLHDGQAWVSIVAFDIRRFRPRWLPPVPKMSYFPEINVRTYVTYGGIPGIYANSLDVNNPLMTFGARTFFYLNYYNAHMSLRRETEGLVRFSHERRSPAAAFHARYRPVGAEFRSAPGTLQFWLSERYAIYSIDRRGSVCRTEIAHPLWPLHEAEARIETNTLTAQYGIRTEDPPALVYYAPHLEVNFWPLERAVGTTS